MDEDELMFEYIMLRLRLTEGLKFAEFKNKFNRDFEETYKAQIEKLLKDNLIYLDDEGIRLTHRGMDISNYVFASFM
jgi:oxygen-independent coproporphyrinogen-3 oxidase